MMILSVPALAETETQGIKAGDRPADYILSLKGDSVSIHPGEKINLDVLVYPDSAITGLTYKTSDKSIAKVDK